MAQASRTRNDYLWLGVIGGILIAAVLLTRAHDDSIKAFIDQKPAWGLFLYVLLTFSTP